MNLVVKNIYIFIFTNVQILLTLVKILLVIIMCYLIYKTLLEKKNQTLKNLNIINVNHLTEGKSFSFKLTHMNPIYRYYLYLKNKKYDDIDIIFSYLYNNNISIPKTITNFYSNIILLKQSLLYLCFFQILILNSFFEKIIDQTFIEDLILIGILFFPYLTMKYRKTCISFLTEILKDEKEFEKFIKFQQTLLNDPSYQFSKRKWGRLFQTICEPYLIENPKIEKMKIKLNPPINFTRFLLLILFLLFIGNIFEILVNISNVDFLLQNISLIDNTTQNTKYLSTLQELHYKYTLGIYHHEREIMQQYFFIKKSGFLESENGLAIKNFLISKNGLLQEMNVREIFEFLKTK
jgi:hypothetical protein